MRRTVIRFVACVAVLAVAWLAFAGCGRRKPADSSNAAFSSPADRVARMTDRLAIAPPTPMADAHFCESESKIPGGHMGSGYSMWWLFAKIELANPGDAAKWAAATKPAKPGIGWRRDLNPLYGSSAKWAITPAEFENVQWYDPVPLVGTRAHGGYIGGHVLIPADGSAVYIWQHWR